MVASFCVFSTVVIRRYVGGLLSTIDLLEYWSGAPSIGSEHIVAILGQAELLVHKLSPGYCSLTIIDDSFDSPTGMWLPMVDFRTARGISEQLWGDTTISLARAGTNFLEYGRLSEQLLDEQYVNNVFSFGSKAHCRRP
jgi:hypothetical protein